MASDTGRGVGLLIARLCLAAIFTYTGIEGIQHVPRTAETLGSVGYPAPTVMAWIAVAAELCGAASLIFGVLTPLGCIALILFLLPTTYSFHLPGLLAGKPGETIQTLKNIGLVGGLVALLFSGPGRFSVDSRMLKGDA